MGHSRKLHEALTGWWWIWFGIYAITGVIGLLGDSTAFFARTVDLTDSTILKLTILNMPLQLVLGVLAAFTVASGSVRLRQAGLISATAACLLAVAHVTTSVVLGV